MVWGRSVRARWPVRRSTRLVLCVVAVLTVYGTLMAQNGLRAPRERFPFFKWELFSRIPPPQRDSYSIRLIEVNGEKLEKPVYFEDAKGIIGRSNSPEGYQTLQQFGRAVERGQFLRSANTKEILESRFMPELTQARYELVQRHFDVLERIECHCFISEKVIGEYQLG